MKHSYTRKLCCIMLVVTLPTLASASILYSCSSLLESAMITVRGLVGYGGVYVFGGSKCGVIVSARDEGGGPSFNRGMLKAGASHGLTWQANWGAGLQPGFTPADYGSVKMVPQFWGKDDVEFSPVYDPQAPIMMGFNEPDHDAGGGGSAMEVHEAVEIWMERVAKARMKGYSIFVAPSIASGLPDRYTGKGWGNEWLPTFLTLCLHRSGCSETINYLGFHMYDTQCSTDPEVVKEWNIDTRVGSMKKLMVEFNGKGMHIDGLWLTEFAGRSDATMKCHTLAQQRGWMEVFVPMLNAEPAVVAYSWFSYDQDHSPFFHDNANLWRYDTDELTELGEAYFRLCNSTSWTQTFVRIVIVFLVLSALVLKVALSALNNASFIEAFGDRLSSVKRICGIGVD